MTALIGAAAVVLWAASAFAQAKPSFAGTWVREMPAAGGGGGGGGRGGGGGWGMEPTITQDATTLTIKYMQGGRGGAEPTEQTRVYKLDGSESKNPGGRGGAEVVSKATWDGAKLVIKTTTPNGEQTMVVSLDAGKLTIATTNPGREGGAPTTNTITYAKKG
jgi:hypothetical protein